MLLAGLLRGSSAEIQAAQRIPAFLALPGGPGQGVVVAFASYLAWFWLLRRYLAGRLAVFSFLAPMFGVVFGVLVLSDPLRPTFVIAALMVGAGIVLVNYSPVRSG